MTQLQLAEDRLRSAKYVFNMNVDTILRTSEDADPLKVDQVVADIRNSLHEAEAALNGWVSSLAVKPVRDNSNCICRWFPRDKVCSVCRRQPGGDAA